MRKISLISITYIKILAYGLGAGLLGLCIAGLYFPTNLHLAGTGLTSFLLLTRMNTLLTENRNAIWSQRRSAWEANIALALKVSTLFSGIFAASMAAQFAAASKLSVSFGTQGPLFSNQPMPLLLNNLRVLLACVALAFIYRGAGILLVVSWNAISWSVSIFAFLSSAHAAGARHAWFYSLALAPHLLLEALAYITAGMCGAFLSKALFKYKLSSTRFFRVSRACVVILAASVGCLWLAMKFEIGLAQTVLLQLQR